MIYATNRVMGVPCVAYDTVRIEAGFAQGKTCLKINLYGGQMFISVSWLWRHKCTPYEQIETLGKRSVNKLIKIDIEA